MPFRRRDAKRCALLAARRDNAMPRGEDFANADPVLEAEGCAEAAAEFTHADRHRQWEDREITDPEDGRRRRTRVNIAVSPLLMLAQRREAGGAAFLTPGMVGAGERLLRQRPRPRALARVGQPQRARQGEACIGQVRGVDLTRLWAVRAPPRSPFKHSPTEGLSRQRRGCVLDVANGRVALTA